MTKETYFEMCEMLGNEIIESEIPVEVSDFPHEIQTYFHIYGLLADVWEPMSGSYLGKDFGPIFEYFRLYDITGEEQLYSISTIKTIDRVRSGIISKKQAAAKANVPPTSKQGRQ